MTVVIDLLQLEVRLKWHQAKIQVFHVYLEFTYRCPFDIFCNLMSGGLYVLHVIAWSSMHKTVNFTLDSRFANTIDPKDPKETQKIL